MSVDRHPSPPDRRERHINRPLASDPKPRPLADPPSESSETIEGQSGLIYRRWAHGCGWTFFHVDGHPGELYARADGEQELRHVGAASIRVQGHEVLEVGRLTFHGGHA